MFKAQTTTPQNAIAFSFILFGLMLHQLWTMDWLLSLFCRGRRNRAGDALSALCMPLSLFPLVSRGLFLLVFGGTLMVLLFQVGVPTSIFNAQSVSPMLATEGVGEVIATVDNVAKHVAETRQMTLGLFWVSGAMLMVSALSFAADVLMLCLLLSIIGTMFQSPVLASLGNEGVNQMTQTIFRKPLLLGRFNVAPILFFLLLNAMQSILLIVLIFTLRVV